MTEHWHFSNLLALVIASLLLTFVFTYLFSVYRKRFLALWALSSLLYLALYTRYLFDPPDPTSFWRLMSFSFVFLCSALLVHTASAELAGQRVSRATWGLGAATLAGTAAFHPLSPAIVTVLPTVLVTGTLVIFSGATILLRVKGAPMGRVMIGWSLTVWGVVIASIPLTILRRELVPASFTITCLLFLVTGIGALILFFEQRGEQLQTELRRVQELLREKDVLLREVHHRVKNNLQVMRSLLGIQAAGCDGEAARSLETAQERIDSMAMVHDDFYQAEGLSGIDIGKYAQRLLNRLRSSHDPAGRVRCELNSAPLTLDLNRMIPLGLFLNEVITNALMHGCHHASEEDGENRLGISISRRDQNLIVTIRDNGPGLPAESETLARGMGLPLLDSLTSQLHGTLRFENDHGLAVRLSFPLERAE